MPISEDSKKPSLADLQKWMMWSITDPRGASAAVRDPNPENLGPRYQAPQNRFRLEHIVSNPKASAGRRLDIYAEAYFARLVEVLSEDFAATRRSLGEEGFTKLIAEYLKRYPSMTTNIGEVGRNLSDFVRQTEAFSQFDYLRDLCGLEWLMIEAFYAPKAAKFDVDKLELAPNGEFDSAVLSFDPATKIVGSDWQIGSYAQGSAELTRGREHVLIFKQDGFIRLKVLSLAEAILLGSLLGGKTLGEASHALESELEPIDDQVGRYFGGWLELGIVSDIQFPTSDPAELQ